jgi:anti-anti-sigma regulatory factor
MRCEQCILEPENAPRALEEFHAALSRCDDCPRQSTGESCAIIKLLVERQMESARALRKMGQKLRSLEAHVRDLESSIERQEAHIQTLESIQKASTEEADAELRAKDEMVEHLDEAIISLSTPIIHVFEGVVVLPLIGALDERRAELMNSKLLAEVERINASHVIIDLTGIAKFDVETIRRIINAAMALRLLGAETNLTGMRADAARAAVSLGADLSHLRTLPTLKEAVVRISREKSASRSRHA